MGDDFDCAKDFCDEQVLAKNMLIFLSLNDQMPPRNIFLSNGAEMANSHLNVVRE